MKSLRRRRLPREAKCLLRKEIDGASRRTRIPNLLIRSQVLYPVELWMHRPPFGGDGILVFLVLGGKGQELGFEDLAPVVEVVVVEGELGELALEAEDVEGVEADVADSHRA